MYLFWLELCCSLQALHKRSGFLEFSYHIPTCWRMTGPALNPPPHRTKDTPCTSLSSRPPLSLRVLQAQQSVTNLHGPSQLRPLPHPGAAEDPLAMAWSQTLHAALMPRPILSPHAALPFLAGATQSCTPPMIFQTTRMGHKKGRLRSTTGDQARACLPVVPGVRVLPPSLALPTAPHRFLHHS